jgi:hypothetical protein
MRGRLALPCGRMEGNVRYLAPSELRLGVMQYAQRFALRAMRLGVSNNPQRLAFNKEGELSMLRSKVVIIALLFSVVLLFAASPAQAGVKNRIPVTGTFPGGTFTGELDLDRFALDQRGNLVAVGVLKGSLARNGNGRSGASSVGAMEVAPAQVGAILGTIVQLITLPVQATGSCEILNLDLGPLDLNLLGLTVNLDEVHLDIAAQPGAGNLLGNLLCAVAGLLDTPNGTLVQLLNAILRVA